MRVLDFTRVLAGPHATRMLTDLGADVIKVEPPSGDLTRFANPRVNGLATYFVQQNVGKRNVSIDLGAPQGIELALHLAEHCDVLIQNYRPGVMDRLGLGPATVAACNPRLVYTSISGYGSTGPWVHRRAYAPVIGAETGFTKGQGDARGGVYANDPHSHADVYTSLEAAVAILAALHQRERTGKASTSRTRWPRRCCTSTSTSTTSSTTGRPTAKHSGASRPETSSCSPSPTASSSSSAPPRERGTFELFLGALELEHLKDDPRFVDVAARRANFDELHDLFLAAGTKIPDATTFEEQFAKHRLAVGCCAAPARSPRASGPTSAGRSSRCPTAVAARSGAQRAMAVQRRRRRRPRRAEVPRGGQPGRAGEVLGTTKPPSTHSKPTGSYRAGCPARAGDTSFPVVPMRATLSRLPTDDSGWAFEVKWDGYRTLAFIQSGRVRLQSSNLYDVTAKYPELAPLGGATGARRAVLDGELVVLDDDGRPRFELIQRHAIKNREAAFYVFDVLSIDDHDTISLAYEDRRRLLAEVLEVGSNWSVPVHRIGDGQALLDATADRGLEGVMAKRLGSKYRPGTRTKEWRKVKHRQQAEVVIGGYTAGTGNRTSSFGALLVGRWEGDSLAFAGGVGTGFTQRRLEELSKRLRDLRTPQCPFDPPPPTAYRRGASWVEPVLRRRWRSPSSPTRATSARLVHRFGPNLNFIRFASGETGGVTGAPSGG